MTSEKYGLGPWYVAKLVNVRGEFLHYVHTDAYKAAAVMNVFHPGDHWWTQEFVGPFDSLEDALHQRQPRHLVYAWRSAGPPGTWQKPASGASYPRMKSL